MNGSPVLRSGRIILVALLLCGCGRSTEERSDGGVADSGFPDSGMCRVAEVDGMSLATPACSYTTTSLTCDTSADCACGCGCHCGSCDCTTTITNLHTCQTDQDCGAFGSCDGGVGASQGSGTTTGPAGDSLPNVSPTATTVQAGSTMIRLLSVGYDQPYCGIPYRIDGNTATVIAGSTCHALQAPFGGDTATASTSTFTGGTATLDGQSLVLSYSYVDAFAAQPGPEMQTIPAGMDQVSTITNTETLARSPP